MPTRTYNKEDLRELLFGDEHKGLTLLSDEQTGTGRWSSYHTLVFMDSADNTLWRVQYSQGLTESQDEQPFEYDPDEVSCDQVEPYEVTITKYRKVKDA